MTEGRYSQLILPEKIMFINNVQALVLQSERMLEMNFLTIWRLQFKFFFLCCPHRGHLMETVNQVNCKKLNLWWKTAVDKSVWIKACCPNVRSIFTLLLVKQIFQNKSLRAASKSQTQYWARITPSYPYD